MLSPLVQKAIINQLLSQKDMVMSHICYRSLTVGNFLKYNGMIPFKDSNLFVYKGFGHATML